MSVTIDVLWYQLMMYLAVRCFTISTFLMSSGTYRSHTHDAKSRKGCSTLVCAVVLKLGGLIWRFRSLRFSVLMTLLVTLFICCPIACMRWMLSVHILQVLHVSGRGLVYIQTASDFSSSRSPGHDTGRHVTTCGIFPCNKLVLAFL